MFATVFAVLLLANVGIAQTNGINGPAQGPATQTKGSSPSAPATTSARGSAMPAAQPDTVLRPADTASLLPAAVFFRGQSATIQQRNSGGVRFGDGALMLAMLVDTAGYSSAVAQKYQGYLLTEVPLNIEGHSLPAGAYGFGFIAGDKFVLMDIGAHDLMMVDSKRDSNLQRPNPLQILPAASAGQYRLYGGRSYINFNKTAASGNQ
ncbi:MAG: hypothetical protein ACYCSN_08085 [Acidobacteriaceae bacterium]